MSHLTGNMKINSRLKRSRHGVYYFRYIIPQSMRASYDGKHEIKRSLGTKDPKLAHLYAHAISVKLLNGYPIKTLLDNLNQFIENIKADNLSIYGDFRGWVAHLPNGVRIEVDPNNRVDHEAGKELVNGFSAQGVVL